MPLRSVGEQVGRRQDGWLGRGLRLLGAALLIVGVIAGPALASHVTEKDLRMVFFAGRDPLPLEPHGRISPFSNPYFQGGDPSLRCVGDAVGTWANWLGTYGDGGTFPSRHESIVSLNSIYETYRLDVYSDGDPVDLVTVQSGFRFGELPDGPPFVLYRQGVPVIDGSLLPEGLHTLEWQATSDWLGGIVNQVPIWVADCERESNVVAGADDVVVEVSTIDVSGFFNVIYLDQPYEQFIGVDGSGVSVTLNEVETDDELIFRIDVWACEEGYWDPNEDQCFFLGDSYYSGPLVNNADGQKYSLHIADGDRTWVFFNDNLIDPNGADLPWEPNYIDAIFTVSPASP